MALIGEVGARLSADNSDFKTKMDEAGQATEKFDKQIKKFGLGFGGVAALASAFRAIVDYARDLENPMDENLKRAKAFALGIDETKKGFLDIGAKALGVVNSLGEWWGRQVAIVKEGRAQVELSEKIAAQGEAAVRFAREHKFEQDKINEYKKEQRELEKKIGETEEKNLDLIEQMVLHTGRLTEAEIKLVNFSTDKQAAEQQTVKILQERLKLTELEAAMKKEDVETAKASRTAFDSLMKDFEANLEKRKKLTFDLADADGKVALLAIEQLELQKRIAAEKRAGKETVDLEVEQLKVQKDLNELLVKQTKEKAAAEAAAARNIAEQVTRTMDLMRVGGIDANQGLSDRALSAKIGNLRGQLGAIETENFGRAAGVGGGGNKNPLTPFLTMELQNAQAEQTSRAEVARNVSVFGEDRAAAMYQGNMPNFERLLGQMNPDLVKQQTDTLKEINRRLANSGLFPK